MKYPSPIRYGYITPYDINENMLSLNPPVAEFSADVFTGEVTFTDESTNTPTSWLWEKNNGSGWTTFSTSQNPTHEFTAGVWAIRLTATNAGGSDSETKNNYISTLAVSFTATPSSVYFTDTVNFDSIVDGNTSTITYNWDIGGVATPTTADLTYVFGAPSTPGTQVILLTVTDDGTGHTADASQVLGNGQNVTLLADVELSDFTADDITPETGQLVTLTPSKSGGSNFGTFTVDWGDGTVNSSLTHTYDDAGVFTITVTFTDSVSGAGDTDTFTKTDYLTVTPATGNQSYSTPGVYTFTAPYTCNYIITVVGISGEGAAPLTGGGGGGGGAGYSAKTIAINKDDEFTVTVGPTTSFGIILQATAGSPGSGQTGGAGGYASGGDVNGNGGNGGNGDLAGGGGGGGGCGSSGGSNGADASGTSGGGGGSGTQGTGGNGGDIGNNGATSFGQGGGGGAGEGGLPGNSVIGFVSISWPV